MPKMKWLPLLFAAGMLLGGLLCDAQEAAPLSEEPPATVAAAPAVAAAKPEAPKPEKKLTAEQAAKLWASYAKLQQAQASFAQQQTAMQRAQSAVNEANTAHNKLVQDVQTSAHCASLTAQPDDSFVCVPEAVKKPAAKKPAEK